MKIFKTACCELISQVQHQSGYYYPNKSPLQPFVFQKLPPGAIRPNGWLKTQLFMQLNGLNGRLFEISEFLNFEECGWAHPEKYGWEELPYWLRGYADLSFLTGDSDALALTEKWTNAILDSQQTDGWFGPNILRKSLEGEPDLWPAMLIINVLKSYHEYTDDERVIPFLLKYFAYVSKQSDAVFKRGWGYTRWADNIDSLIWLYNRTDNDDWLLDLIHRIHSNAADWMMGVPTRHNVNISQGFREPALYSLVTNPFDSSYIETTYENFQSVIDQFGQFSGGGFAGDENCRDGFIDPRQGFETCGIAELMHSCSILTRLTGDCSWADRCESLAFNSLPAALDPFLARSIHYITCANCIQLDDKLKTRKQFQNFFPMLAYKAGVYQYHCCAHNYGFAWPYFTEELWLATTDYGLCASMYAPCEVTARVGLNGGIAVTIIEKTEYPFENTVEFHFRSSDSVEFKLYLRVPQWCQENVVVTLNGNRIYSSNLTDDKHYIVINNTWHNGDILSLKLPMSIETTVWNKNHNSASVSYGPLSFSLDIDEKWNHIGGTFDWPDCEVLPASNWNYGLLLSNKQKWTVHKVKEVIDGVNPFIRSNVPVEINVLARRIPTWKADEQNIICPLPVSPVISSEHDETVRLIPMGATRLRVTSFPMIAE